MNMSAPDTPPQGGAQPPATPPNPAAQQSPPGYPQYPQGGYGAYYWPQYPYYNQYPYGQQYPYAYQPYAYPFPYAMPGQPARRRDTYQLVVSIISIVLLSFVILGGLIAGVFVLLGLVAAQSTQSQSLSLAALLPLLAVVALAGGGVGLYFTIRVLMHKSSAMARMPSFWVPLGLTALALGVGITEHAAQSPQGPALLQAPLLLLAGILPAITIFALTNERLGEPSTWRRAWMSFLSGMFLATIFAGILELIASVVLAILLRAGSTNVSQLNTNSPSELLFTGLLLSVIAPLAEEGLKPVGPLVILGRLRGPAEAFLLGMAAGVGFDIFETTGYITQGQADWIVVAVERVGAGLLHGVGAGMATLGWYYLFRGRGASNRYLKGFGALAYALLQHGLFNGSNLLVILPGPIGDAMRAPVWFFGLPETGIIYLFVVIYAIIIGVLLTVTYYLRHSPLNRPPEIVPAASPPSQVPAAPPYLASTSQMSPSPAPAGTGPGGAA